MKVSMTFLIRFMREPFARDQLLNDRAIGRQAFRHSRKYRGHKRTLPNLKLN